MKNFPYVYIVTNKFTSEFYIGYREANSLPSEQDILRYKTSSRIVKPKFDEFVPQIVAEFFTETATDDAYWFEQQLISEHIGDPLCLNRYYIKKGSVAKFKSKVGRKCSEETKLKISKTKNAIDPETGLTNAQLSATSSVKTRQSTGSYKTGTIKANETKIKNNSNATGGKKSSITKNAIDPETGLTNAQLAGIQGSKTKNTVDCVTGLTNAQLAGIQGSKTKNTIDPETGLTNAQLAGIKLKATLQQIDPETGLTLKQKQIMKAMETKRRKLLQRT